MEEDDTGKTLLPLGKEQIIYSAMQIGSAILPK